MLPFRSLVLALALLAVAGCGCDHCLKSEGAAFIAPDLPGPYGVSATTMTWMDARGITLTAEVWYPIALNSDGSLPCTPKPYPEIPITGQACRDQAPYGPLSPFPVVAFSHGNAGIRFQSIFLTESLAQHGYVVVAPDHPHDTLLDFDETQLGTVAMRRPGDITSAVDELVMRVAGNDSGELATSGARVDLSGIADASEFGMSGHSFGGWTTFAVAGGQIDVAGLITFCTDATNAAVGYDLCRIIGLLPEGTTNADFDPPDPRATSALSMAPAGWYSFAPGAVGTEPNGLDNVPPTLLFGGSKDDSETVANEIQPLYDRLPVTIEGTENALGILQNAGHYAFTDICLIGDIQPDCQEEAGGYINLDEAHSIVSELAIAWFGVYLEHDSAYQPYLDKAAGEWADLAYAK